MSSQAQRCANQANAQLSTGPTSPDGKSRSSLNAVKTGLTGRTVLLPGDDAELYTAHLDRFASTWKPQGEEEQSLVQSLADTGWRLLRIPALEMGIYAVGHLEFAELFPETEDVRKHLIEAKVFLTYQRQLNNLGIQEARLRRQREKDTQTLTDLQTRRRQETHQQLSKAARLYIEAVHAERHTEWEPSDFGFEFTIEQIELRAIEIEPDLFLAWALEQRNAA